MTSIDADPPTRPLELPEPGAPGGGRDRRDPGRVRRADGAGTAGGSDGPPPMRFALDAWDPGYGASTTGGTEEAGGPVDAGVEIRAERWDPVDVEPAAVETVVFVDGVRRIDGRVWITDVPPPVGPFDDQPHPDEVGVLSRPGLCASVAAGAVVCRPGSAQVVGVRVGRGLHTAAGAATDIVVPGLGVYGLYATDDDDDQALHLSVDTHMARLEVEVAAAVEVAEPVLTVLDGPLRGRDDADTVGYIKTQHVQYLEGRPLGVIGRLAEGQRSPLFRIGGRFPRWSWYLRLPGPVAHPLAGVVRLELPAVGALTEVAGAVARADRISGGLPRVASRPHTESRAPQNLVPIAALERQLRHRLGDPGFIERCLRITAAAAA
ncbi:MAG: DNA double-strand break repair nuclease NurA [Acidimicrobiales bacterium]